MNLDKPEIKSIVTDGKKFYSVTDAINEFVHSAKWDGTRPKYI